MNGQAQSVRTGLRFGGAALHMALHVFVVTFVAASAMAQTTDRQEVPRTAAPLAATFNPVPSFERIKTDIDMVGSGLEPLLKLDEELQTLGRELVEQVKQLSADQQNPLLASEANKLITKMQSRLITTIGEVLVNSDLIELGITSANRKLHSLERYLKRTETRFSQSAEALAVGLEDAKQEALDAVNDYLAFIDGVEDPMTREEKLEALGLEAKVQEKKFQLDLIRLDQRRQAAVARGYSNMNTALGRWIDDFNTLKSKTKVMVRQLDAQRDFLAKGVQMSVDAARVRHFMENPLALPDGTSIQAVNEKVAKIFSMIDVFTGIQGKVQESLFGFSAITVAEDLQGKEKDLANFKNRALDLKKQILAQ